MSSLCESTSCATHNTSATAPWEPPQTQQFLSQPQRFLFRSIADHHHAMLLVLHPCCSLPCRSQCAGLLDKAGKPVEEVVREEVLEECGYRLPDDQRPSYVAHAVSSSGVQGSQHAMYFAEVGAWVGDGGGGVGGCIRCFVRCVCGGCAPPCAARRSVKACLFSLQSVVRHGSVVRRVRHSVVGVL